MFEGPTLGPKLNPTFADFSIFLRFLGPIFGPGNWDQKLVQDLALLKKLNSQGSRGPVSGPSFWAQIWSNFSFFRRNLRFFGRRKGSLSCRAQALLQGVAALIFETAGACLAQELYVPT